jgi:hypothetical protein
MAIKRRMKDGTIKYVTFKPEDKDAIIKRLEALLKEVTETLSEVMDYDKAVAAASTYDCYK